MKMSDEVLKWLRENAYAVKEEGFWLVSDFPIGNVPDRLHIPVNKRFWQQILTKVERI